MSLFKYCSPLRIDILENLKIRFSPQSALNDPFDCLADTKLLEDLKWGNRIVGDITAEAETKDIINSVYKNTPRRFPTTDATEKEVRRLMAANISKFKQYFVNQQRSDIQKNFRILCLSTVAPDDPKALLLWGHYATDTNGHDGMVLEFDDEHQWVKSHQVGHPDRQGDAGPVNYSPTRATYVEPELLRKIIFTKSEHWRYEGEYRLIRYIGDRAFETDKIDALVKLEPRVLRSVTLGVGASDTLKQRLLRIRDNNPALSELRIRKAQLHPDEFRLQLEDVTGA